MAPNATHRFDEDLIDQATFEQILEMDDDDDEGGHEFSRGIVFDFLDQADQTFTQMDQKLEEKDLQGLSDLGHFLKGSSATLGFRPLRDACEKIQHYGHKLDATGLVEQPDEDVCLEKIRESLEDARTAYTSIKIVMVDYFNTLDD